MKKLIIDYSHLAYRNYSINGELQTTSGEKSGVVFGILRSLRSLCNKFKPDLVVMCSDVGRSFRKDMIESYKASRVVKTEKERLNKEDYYKQLADTSEVLKSLGIPVVGIEGLEADDICAIICKKLTQEADHNIVVSGDKDLLQLVSDHTDYYNPNYDKLVSLSSHPISEEIDKVEFSRYWATHSTIHPETFTYKSEKIGKSIPMNVWLLYRSLVGDSSDELSGIKGIGPVTAQKLVTKYKTIEEILSEKSKDTSMNLKMKESLNEEDLRLQYKMIDLDLITESKQTDSIPDYIQSVVAESSRDIELFNGFLVKFQLTSVMAEARQFLSIIPCNTKI